MLIEKAPLPRGLSFVLKSSALERALAGFAIEVSLHHTVGALFFDAHFWPPNPRVPHERLYVRAGAVPGGIARAARNHVEADVLPDLVAGLADLLARPDGSPARREEQVFWRPLPPRLGAGR